jgi:tRNA threonylcarbamoyladenosine biosynthesis protein TsaE
MKKMSTLSSEIRTVTLTGTGIKKQTFRLQEVADWRVIADVLMPLLMPGTILALSGNLGAGKTTFVQILAEMLGSKRVPQSPTFALMRSYPTKNLRLIHVDAYRLEDERELLPLDLDEELADKKSILVLEWPERVEKWLGRHPGVIWLKIEVQ